uniref:Ig-like domain-containing protein n=1 Tax=Dicentrarchus labrax TaxID=13489 RepID=A0A8C4HXN5_DICLA
ELKIPNRASLTVQPNWPQIFSGETITLRCEIDGGGDTQWTYEWKPDKLNSQSPTKSEYRIISATVSHSGVYRCKGRNDSYSSTEWISNRASLTLQPNWPQIFSSETITFRCEIQGGGDTQWTYEWKTPSSEKPSNQNEHSIRSATVSHSGEYSCKGRMKHAQQSSTEWSDPIKLTVFDKPQLTVSPLWLSPGDSVTLNCEVEHPSAGWRFYWYKAVPDLSSNYSYELLPGSSNGTEQDSYIVHGQIHTAGYMCRAGRGDPVYYSQDSKPMFVWSGGQFVSVCPLKKQMLFYHLGSSIFNPVPLEKKKILIMVRMDYLCDLLQCVYRHNRGVDVDPFMLFSFIDKYL